MAKRVKKVVVAETPKLVKLDLGCGEAKAEGFIGVDKRSLPGVDVVLDLSSGPGSEPWPWEDGSVDEINCSFMLPYLSSEARIYFMDECHRILKKGSKMGLRVAHSSCMRSLIDPYFQWPPICEFSFLMYNAEWRKQNGCAYYPIKADFDFGYGYTMEADMNVRNEDYKQFAIKYYNNAVLDLIVTLTKR